MYLIRFCSSLSATCLPLYPVPVYLPLAVCLPLSALRSTVPLRCAVPATYSSPNLSRLSARIARSHTPPFPLADICLIIICYIHRWHHWYGLSVTTAHHRPFVLRRSAVAACCPRTRLDPTPPGAPLYSRHGHL